MIGLDLDNTIACYDTVFQELAVETGVVQGTWSGSRGALRRTIRETRGDATWAMLQARVYGSEFRRVAPFPGALDCVRALQQRGLPVAIVSHKTRVAAADTSCDLHVQAWQWLGACGLLREPPNGVPRERVFFEETRDQKVARIGELRCSHFVDDLPEVFDHAGFPSTTVRVLFDPARECAGRGNAVVFHDWRGIQEYLLDYGSR